MSRAALTLARAALAQIIPTLPGYREQHGQAMAAIDAALAHPCPDPGACEAAQICQVAAERLSAPDPAARCWKCGDNRPCALGSKFCGLMEGGAA